jgi:hypothetical protein
MKRRLRKLVKDPKHWRARAHEMRSVAAQVNDPKPRPRVQPMHTKILPNCARWYLAHAGKLRRAAQSGEVQARDRSG